MLDMGYLKILGLGVKLQVTLWESLQQKYFSLPGFPLDSSCFVAD
jgi:hypothetical protein